MDSTPFGAWLSPEEEEEQKRAIKAGATLLTIELDGIPMYTVENLAKALQTTEETALSIMEEIGIVNIGSRKLVSREALKNFLEGNNKKKKYSKK